MNSIAGKLVQEIDYKKRNWRRDIGINVFALNLALVCVISWYRDFLAINPLIMIAGVVIAFPLHELMHGLFFKLWSGKVKFGATMTKFGPALYAASPGALLSRNKMILLALAPQVLTVIFLLVGYNLSFGNVRSLLFLAAVLNLGGGAGDYYCVLQMFKYNKKLQVEDSPTGLKFYIPEKES